MKIYALLVLTVVTASFAMLSISNLSERCVQCLCHVVGCNLAHTCTEGYCGPYYISRVYWVDAGRPTLPDDNSNRSEAYADCARDYHCAMRTVRGYLAKFGKDCNGDGVTDCFDYMMINHNGGYACSEPLEVTTDGQKHLALFRECFK